MESEKGHSWIGSLDERYGRFSSKVNDKNRPGENLRHAGRRANDTLANIANQTKFQHITC